MENQPMNSAVPPAEPMPQGGGKKKWIVLVVILALLVLLGWGYWWWIGGSAGWNAPVPQTNSDQSAVNTNESAGAPSAAEKELDQIDAGANLDAELEATDKDINQL